MQPDLIVRPIFGLVALTQFANQIDTLNWASARPNPFLSSAFLHSYALNNEYFPDSEEIRLYTVWKDQTMVGCLPMRWRKEYFGPRLKGRGLSSVRVCFLAPLDVEQPGLMCAPEDEEHVAVALINHLTKQTPRFGMLEFIGQRPDSVLYRTLHRIEDRRFRVRDIDVEPYNEITLRWPDVAAYFRALSPKMRRNIGSAARHLFAAGTTEIVLAEGGAAVSAWLDAYCDLESRSWKHNTAASVMRHPRRLQFYRNLALGNAGFAPSFIGILLDGTLIAGMLNGSNSDAPADARGVWEFETAYDDAYTDLGPGQLLTLLTADAALKRNEKFVNLLHSFSYYKQRWKADQIVVKNVQLIRRGSLHHLRGLVGDLRRHLKSRTRAAESHPHPAHHGINGDPSGSKGASKPPHPDRTMARQMTARALAYSGPGVQRLDFAQIRTLMPFDTGEG